MKLFLEGRAHNCTSFKNCNCGSCQCSVDPVLSSHDAPYFETYLSSQAIEKGIGNGALVSAFLVCFFILSSYKEPTSGENDSPG